MLKKHISTLFLVTLLFLGFSQLSRCEDQPTPVFVAGWQVENLGGYCSESNGVFRLWSNGGNDCPSIALYKQINITSDFTFSLQVNAATIESCAVFVRGSLPVAGSTNGFNFEFGHYGQGDFLFLETAATGCQLKLLMVRQTLGTLCN